MIPLREVECPICGSSAPMKVRYPANFTPGDMRFTARKTPTRARFRIVQCRGCGLVFSSPVPEIDVISDLYRQGGYISEPQLENMIGDYLAECARFMHLCDRERLLEIGCSSGIFLERAKQRFGFGSVHGVEPCAKSLEAMPVSVRDNVIADILRPGQFAPESFDCIVFFQVFDHVPDPNGFLQLVRHYLKKDGVAIALHHNIRAPMPAILGPLASTYDIQHMFLWDKRTMPKILEKNGLRVHEIRDSANRYQLDHVVRMLPLPAWLKQPTHTLLKALRLSELSVRVSVENMVIAFTRDDYESQAEARTAAP